MFLVCNHDSHQRDRHTSHNEMYLSLSVRVCMCRDGYGYGTERSLAVTRLIKVDFTSISVEGIQVDARWMNVDESREWRVESELRLDRRELFS